MCDSGSTGTLIKDSSLPFGAKPTITKEATYSTTTHGTHKSNEINFMEHIQLPEFNNGRSIQGLKANVFHSPTCPYDVILGVDFLQAIGMKFHYDLDIIQWLDTVIDMKNVRELKAFLNVHDIGIQPKDSEYFNDLRIINNDYYDILEDDFLCDDTWDNFAAEILERKYDRITAKQVAAEQHHLSQQQQIMLESTLEKYEILFDGKLGHYTDRKFHIDSVEDAQPVFQNHIMCHFIENLYSKMNYKT